MECNVCLRDAKCVEITYRQVTFKTAHCECGKVRREVTTTLQTKEEMSTAIRDMHALNAMGPSAVRLSALEYLERMLLRLDPNRTTQQRRHDLWEKRYLKETLREDYA
jgi:hypothetical protein